MSHQSYGPKVAVPRLLQILERQESGALLHPRLYGRSYPDIVRQIVDGGHEVAHHGYLHEPMQGIDAATEARYIDRGLDGARKVAGVEPVGYRAPWWELNWHSPALLADRGFLYDSSLLDGDAPYRFAVAEGDRPGHRGDPRRLDAGRLGTVRVLSRSHRQRRDREPRPRSWRCGLSRPRRTTRQGSCFVLTNHPFISGRPSKAVALEQLIERVKAMDGMWVTTMEEIAEHTNGDVHGSPHPRPDRGPVLPGHGSKVHAGCRSPAQSGRNARPVTPASEARPPQPRTQRNADGDSHLSPSAFRCFV